MSDISKEDLKANTNRYDKYARYAKAYPAELTKAERVEQHKKDTERFLAKGGKMQHIPAGVSAHDNDVLSIAYKDRENTAKRQKRAATASRVAQARLRDSL